MDGKIYDLLMKIDGFKIEKFGLEKDNRVFLKRLLIDENFLNTFINRVGYDGVYEFLLGINNSLSTIKENIDNIKNYSNANDKIKSIINDGFGDNLENIEKEREAALERFVASDKEREEHNRKMKEEEEGDRAKYNQILNNLK